MKSTLEPGTHAAKLTHTKFTPRVGSHIQKFLESLTPWILKWPRISIHLFGSLFVSFPSTCSCCFFNFVFWLETVIQLFHQRFDLLWRQNKATKGATDKHCIWNCLNLVATRHALICLFAITYHPLLSNSPLTLPSLETLRLHHEKQQKEQKTLLKS